MSMLDSTGTPVCLAAHDQIRESGHLVFKMSRGGSGQEVSIKNITGGVESGRVKRFSNLVGRIRWGQVFSFRSHGSGRVGSGQEVMKI